MRKILFSVLTGGIILLGCNKDGGQNASIVGTWNVNNVIAQTYLDNELQGSDTTTSGSVQFDSNGGFTSIDENNSTSAGTYIYNSSSKLLTVISDSDTSNLTVTNLTSSNLHLAADETEVVNGYTLRVKVDADYSR